MNDNKINDLKQEFKVLVQSHHEEVSLFGHSATADDMEIELECIEDKLKALGVEI